MSTHYDLEYNICNHCGRYETRNIGLVHVLCAYDESDLDSELVLESWSEWKKFLQAECKKGARIKAWSGGSWEIELSDFIERIEKHNRDCDDIEKSFRDEEGYVLSYRGYC